MTTTRAKTSRRKAKMANMDEATDRLYKAVQHYVEKKGGKLIVIGGIQIQQWPDEGESKFLVAVKCLGRKPEFATEGHNQGNGP